MQRRVLWLAGAVAVIAVAFGLRNFGRHAANKVVDHELDQMIASLPPGYTAQYGKTETNPLTGTVTLHNVNFAHDGHTLWTAETLTFAGASQPGLTKVFDPAAYPGGRPVSTQRFPLLGEASASHLVFAAPRNADGQVTIRSVTLSGLSARQFFESPTLENSRTRAFADDAALAFAARDVELHDVHAANAHDADVATIGTALLRDYDAGKFSRVALEKMTLDASTTKPKPSHLHAALQSVEMRDYDFGPVLLKARDGAASRAGVQFSGAQSASVSGEGFAMTLDQGPAFSIASCSGSNAPADSSGLQKGKFACRDMTVSLNDMPLSAVAAAGFAAFGMRSFTLDIRAEAATDPLTNHVKLNEDLDFHDLGMLHLRASAAFIPPAGGNADPRAMLATTTVDHADLVWNDKGLTDRAFATAAALMHTTPDTVRAQLAIPLVSLGFFLPDQPDAVDQVTAFLNHPETLSITLNPPRPFTLAEAGQAPSDQKARLMGVHVQGN